MHQIKQIFNGLLLRNLFIWRLKKVSWSCLLLEATLCSSVTLKRLGQGSFAPLAYHVVPESPLMYVIQSRRFNFLSPMRLPYNPVIDFSPPPVVMIATTGTCWAEEDGTFTLTASNIASHIAVRSGHHSQPRSLFRRKDSKMKQQLLLPLFPFG